MSDKRPWADSVSDRIREKIEERLERSRDNRDECRRWRAINWLQLRAIEIDAQQRGVPAR